LQEYMTHTDQIIDRIHTLCLRANHILIVSHKNCGDATGALLAFSLYLSARGVSHTIWLPAPVMNTFSFLPGAERIRHGIEVLEGDADFIVALDASDARQAGIEHTIEAWREKGTPIAVIDHHYTNDEFGTVNWVDKNASACCLMVYTYLKAVGEPMTPDMATCLLTGILTDTGSFSNGATNYEALAVASDLLACGAQLSTIMNHTFRAVEDMATLRLWGKVLSKLKYHKHYGVAIACITQDDLFECGVKEDDLEGVANIMNVVKDIRVGMVLMELSDGTIKGSLRTTRDDVDVAAIATFFGGGGHKKASGFSLKGKLLEIEEGWQVI